MSPLYVVDSFFSFAAICSCLFKMVVGCGRRDFVSWHSGKKRKQKKSVSTPPKRWENAKMDFFYLNLGESKFFSYKLTQNEVSWETYHDLLRSIHFKCVIFHDWTNEQKKKTKIDFFSLSRGSCTLARFIHVKMCMTWQLAHYTIYLAAQTLREKKLCLKPKNINKKMSENE